MQSAQQSRVVILGGGFAGSNAAKALAGRPEVSVTLIDRHSFHTYPPSLYEAANELTPRETLIIPYRDIFDGKKIDLIKDEIIKVDKSKKTIYLKSGQHKQYDYLVLSLGAVSNDFGIPGVKEHAFQFREFKEAILLRDNLRTAFQLVHERGKDEVSVAVCGGGFSGVELAGELRYHLEKLKKEYPCEKVNITILEASPQLLPGMPIKVVELAKKKLSLLKVEVMLNDPVTEVKHDGVRLKSGRWVPSNVTIWTSGTKSNPLAAGMQLPLDERSRPVVNEYLHVIGQPHIYVAGDLAGYTNPKTGKGIPPQAYQAEAMGKNVALNILRSIRKLPLKEFKPESNDFIIPVGHRDSVALMFGRVWQGFWPWFLIRFIELKYLVSLMGLTRAWPTFWEEVKIVAE